MKNTFNKGDLIEITRPGQCWTSFEETFKELGMKNPGEKRQELSEGTLGMVLNSIPRYKGDGPDGELMVVVLVGDMSYLYGSTGIKIIQSVINENYEIY